MPLYEPEAAFATQPGSLNHGLPGVREALAGFIAMKGTLDLKVTRVLEASDLALVATVWSFTGTGPDGAPVKLAAKCGCSASSGRRLLALRDRQPLGNGLNTGPAGSVIEARELPNKMPRARSAKNRRRILALALFLGYLKLRAAAP